MRKAIAILVVFVCYCVLNGAEAFGSGIDNNTVLMLHCDGNDGSTNFVDSSGNPHTVTVHGNAEMDASQSRFGGASARFDGSNSYLSLADHTDWDFSGDFTVDFWMKMNAIQTGYFLIGNADMDWGSNGWEMQLNNQGMIQFLAMYSAPNWTPYLWGYHNMTTDDWYHIAAVRYGTAMSLYVDGQSIGTLTNDPVTYINGNYDFQIGSSPHALTYDYSGWIDEVRISNGVARWTSDFTPPSQPYSCDVIPEPSSLLLLGFGLLGLKAIKRKTPRI